MNSIAAFVMALSFVATSISLSAIELSAAEPGRASRQAATPSTSDPQTDSQVPAAESPQQGGPTLTLNVSTTPVDVKANFQVPLVLTGATGIDGFVIIFDYNSTFLNLKSISQGEFLTRDGEAAPINQSDSPVGHVVVSTTRPPGSVGLDGNGTVCVLNFQAVGSGTSNLKIKRAYVVDSSHKIIPVRIVQNLIVIN